MYDPFSLALPGGLKPACSNEHSHPGRRKKQTSGNKKEGKKILFSVRANQCFIFHGEKRNRAFIQTQKHCPFAVLWKLSNHCLIFKHQKQGLGQMIIEKAKHVQVCIWWLETRWVQVMTSWVRPAVQHMPGQWARRAAPLLMASDSCLIDWPTSAL